MIREFKLRVWDKRNNKYLSINSDNYTLRYQGDIWIASIQKSTLEESIKSSGIVNNNPNYVMEQFIGLVDEKGRSIYEGDIIKWCNYYSTTEIPDPIFYIEWRKVYAGYKFAAIRPDGKEWDFYGGIPDEIEVIGNIHENFQLLK